jgi:penicillin-binding protein 2D
MEPITINRFAKTWEWTKLILRTLSLLLLPIFIFLVAIIIYAKVSGPPPLQVPQTTIFYGEDGTILSESQKEGQNRYWVPLNEISDSLINATIAIEDQRFYDHSGFDFKRIVGAVLVNIKAGAKIQGASTISQQYARNLFLEHDKTWSRKFQEALYALRLEMNYSKKDILEGYLNTIYYGHRSYGIQAASQYFFGKNASELNLAEASMLAGIPKGPLYYSPIIDLAQAKNRQQLVLNAMVEQEFISKQEMQGALDKKLVFTQEHMERKTIAPYFIDSVQYILKNNLDIDPETIEQGGLRVYTTLNPEYQALAEQWVNNLIDSKSDIQTALVAMDPKTGDIKALIGGRDYNKSTYNRATQARRAPGSTFKPFLYYTALKHGFTPSTTLSSEPTTFRLGEDKTYTPHNFRNYYANDFITMAQAIALSDNIYAVKTNMFLGPENLVDTAKELGIDSKLDPIPSLALGSKPVGVLEMVNAYSVFANSGYQVESRFITKITDFRGEVIYENKAEKERVMDEKYAYVMTDMLRGIFDERLNGYMSVTGANVKNLIDRPTAGKTGSTPNDSWMIGYTPQLTTGVWVGYDKGEQLHSFNDALFAKQIWAHFMHNALADRQVIPFKKPKGVVGVYVNPQNGLLATDQCPVKRMTYYIEGTEPTDYCQEHEVKKMDPEVKKEKKNSKDEKGTTIFDKILKWFD